MIKLFVDTSSDYLSLVLTSNKEVLSSIRILAGRKMSEEILGQINNIISVSQIDISDIDEFYVVTGPGSFTGVRIGVAMVMGIAEGLSKECYGITSLDCGAITSGLDKCSIAVRLKGDLFAIRKYSFKENIFSDYFCDTISNDEMNNYIIINSDKKSNIDLEKVAIDDKYIMFQNKCEPLYLRKSEAELNIDKNRINR